MLCNCPSSMLSETTRVVGQKLINEGRKRNIASTLQLLMVITNIYFNSLLIHKYYETMNFKVLYKYGTQLHVGLGFSNGQNQILAFIGSQ